jgi:hypothetical protein
MRHLFILALCIAATACIRPFEPSEADVLGEWQKIDDTLPPINLELTRAGEDLQARLRLSGVDLNGTAELDGSQLLLVVPGRTEPLIGEFISSTELRLRFDAPAGSYTLRKRTH